MNAIKTFGIPCASRATLLVATALALASTAARPAPRSEMVVPGYKACASKAGAPAKPRTERPAPGHAGERRDAGAQPQAATNGVRCAVNASS